jgi:hypothetical protein
VAPHVLLHIKVLGKLLATVLTPQLWTSDDMILEGINMWFNIAATYNNLEHL